ncbi:MAG: DUF6314 family protein [Verrucomicrobiota bacterium JB022]|nr:DUF6314 family protein [Verrucomicrobiota bacterium JB022]
MSPTDPALDLLWSRLAAVRRFRFDARNGPGSQTDWSGSGVGTVAVSAENGWLFAESGTYTTPHGHQLPMRNTYHWQREGQGIRLSHRRFQQPVYLFTLQTVDATGRRWQTDEPHLCGADLYQATLLVEDAALKLDWTIVGPKKNEALAYVYE